MKFFSRFQKAPPKYQVTLAEKIDNVRLERERSNFERYAKTLYKRFVDSRYTDIGDYETVMSMEIKSENLDKFCQTVEQNLKYGGWNVHVAVVRHFVVRDFKDTISFSIKYVNKKSF